MPEDKNEEGDQKTARKSALSRLIGLGNASNPDVEEVNDALREAHSQFDSTVDATELPYFLRAHVDMAIPVPGHGVFLSGWIVDPAQKITGMFLSVRGRKISEDFASRIEPVPRNDVAEAYRENCPAGCVPGFLCFVRFPNAFDQAVETRLILRTSSGEYVQIPFRMEANFDANHAVNKIIGELPVSSRNLLSILDRHVGPAVEALWASRLNPRPEVTVKAFGSRVDEPKWTIVVPLYGRYDFIHYQLSQFADDPDFREAELLYVVDDPLIIDSVLGECASIYPIFDLPFQVLYTDFSVGFAGANNLGAAHSGAETLVLMNSDVLPANHGWLERLDLYRQNLPYAGGISPKLLYEDGSIQHGGITFRRHHFHNDLWINEHPHKGQPRWFLPASEPAIVPVVAGACMMVNRSLYESLGGLDDSFVLGHLKHTDLCLKLLQAGYKNYCVPDVELYNLEHKSNHINGIDDQDSQINLFSYWQHTRKWDSQIRKIVE